MCHSPPTLTPTPGTGFLCQTALGRCWENQEVGLRPRWRLTLSPEMDPTIQRGRAGWDADHELSGDPLQSLREPLPAPCMYVFWGR